MRKNDSSISDVIKDGFKEFRSLLEKKGNQNLVNSFEKLLSGLLQHAPFLGEIFESDSERGEKRAVYSIIADFFKEKFELTEREALALTYQLCGEGDPELLNELGDSRVPSELIAAAKDKVVSIKVEYQEVERPSVWRRTVDIYYQKEGKPHRYRASAELSWDDLPGDVREDTIRSGVSTVSFTLFPLKNTDEQEQSE